MYILKFFCLGSNCLISYRCVKYFCDQYEGDSFVFILYVLKIGFFFELEKFLDEKFWSNEELFVWLYGMMNYFFCEVKEEVFGSYFVFFFFISKSEMEDILFYVIQRVLDDLFLLMLFGVNVICCYQLQVELNFF